MNNLVSLTPHRQVKEKLFRSANKPTEERIRELEEDMLRVVERCVDNDHQIIQLREELQKQKAFIRKLLHLIEERLPSTGTVD